MISALNPVIHPIPRIRICALLDPVTEEEFSTLRDLLGTTDSALSKPTTLANAGYVAQRRAVRSGRSRAWIALTSSGRQAFRLHLEALAALVNTPSD